MSARRTPTSLGGGASLRPDGGGRGGSARHPLPPGRARGCRPHLRCGAAGDRPRRPRRRGTERHPRLREHRRLHRARRTRYLGATVGRYANRISLGSLVVDGTTHRLSRNEGEHHLHGGHVGFDRKVWEIRRCGRDGEPSLVLGYHSADGEEGYPGAVDVEVEYTLVRSEHAADAIPSNDGQADGRQPDQSRLLQSGRGGIG